AATSPALARNSFATADAAHGYRPLAGPVIEHALAPHSAA
nr:hypothetical protein [Tanacetum cinerariifolium]